jgi:hypothetical protein
MWLSGYRWWVASSTQDTAAQKFALWDLAVANGSGGAAFNIAAATITSGAFATGQFNTVLLGTPVALTPDIPYIAATGGALTHGFPDTTNQFAAAQPYSSGITNGPLFAYGSPIGSGFPQNPFTTAGADPSVLFPNSNNANDILWIDVIVTDQAPGGTTAYRAYPNMIMPYSPVGTAGGNTTDTTGYTLALQFSLTQACTLQKIWHYSYTSTTALPTRCCIWNVNSQTEVAGTDNSSPSWKNTSGAAASTGDGWIYCDYSASGVTLNASQQYKVSTFHGAGAHWFSAEPSMFGAGNTFGAGFTNGPLVIPNNASATPGQQSWDTAVFGYPNTSNSPEADWIDVEVQPVTAAPAPSPQYLYQMRQFR